MTSEPIDPPPGHALQDIAPRLKLTDDESADSPVEQAKAWASGKEAELGEAAAAASVTLAQADINQLLTELNRRCHYCAVVGMVEGPGPEPIPMLHRHGDENALSGMLCRLDEMIRTDFHRRIRLMMAADAASDGIRPATPEETAAIARP